MRLFSFLKGAGKKTIDISAENNVNAVKLMNTVKANGLKIQIWILN